MCTEEKGDGCGENNSAGITAALEEEEEERGENRDGKRSVVAHIHTPY